MGSSPILQLSAAEQRRILLASRIRFGPEYNVPRQRAIDRMIQNGLFVAKSDEWFTRQRLAEVFKEVGGVPTLRIAELREGLKRLEKAGKVESKYDSNQRENVYRLTKLASDEVKADFVEAARRIDRVLNILYGSVLVDRAPQSLMPFFLEFVCEVFIQLGSRWASYLSGEPLDPNVDFETIGAAAEDLLRKHGFDGRQFHALTNRSVYFFQYSDPDFDQLKFSLGQSLYVARLLGMEERDYLSEEIFSSGVLYLDSSVIISALLSEARHHSVFQELRKVCSRLGVRLRAARPTVDEVRRVAAIQERDAPSLYDLVPEALAPQVKGDFFYTYVAMRKVDPTVTPAAVFEPFHNVTDNLRALGIEIIDDECFESLCDSNDFENIKFKLQESSEAIRKKQKPLAALEHDGQVFLFLRQEQSREGEKLWLVSRDSSLPTAWAALQPKVVKLRCFLLDGLLQSISPFVVSDNEAMGFSQVFSQAIAAQLIPQGRIFDIDDFKIFHDLELDCTMLTVEELQESLLAIKQHVLKGASYGAENREVVAYELRRFLAKRHSQSEQLIREREKLEQKISAMQSAHLRHVEELQANQAAELSAQRRQHSESIDALQRESNLLKQAALSQKLLRARRWLFAKKIMALGLLILSFWAVTRWAISFGQGQNIPQRVVSFSMFYLVVFFLNLLVWKFTLFRNERLREVFPTWKEVKDLIP